MSRIGCSTVLYSVCTYGAVLLYMTYTVCTASARMEYWQSIEVVSTYNIQYILLLYVLYCIVHLLILMLMLILIQYTTYVHQVSQSPFDTPLCTS